ncbi:MAG TPA: HD domain-containing phosphohydrolase [Gaiellaceae bacterium]|nr:HD domain-containing phosphohydrolase [Gaiellaceae bacterium]
MGLRTWVHVTRAASVLGLGVFAAVTLAEPEGTPLSAFFSAWVYNALMALACVIAASRVLAVRRERAAWAVFTAALASWTFGEIWFSAARPEAYPSAADLGYLGFYPLAYAGMVLLLRARARAIGAPLWLDGLTASVAAAAIGAAVLVGLVLDTTEGSLSAVVTNLAYPLGDVLLLSAVFGVFSLASWRPGRRWTLLGLGLLLTALADAVYLFQAAEGTYVEGTWLDILWPSAMLLVAASAWAGDRCRAQLEVEGRPLLAVPAACALAAIGVLVYDHFHRVNLLALALSTAALVLVVLRLALTFRENARLLELTRTEATTDALTGLGNRRKLLADLERRLDPKHPEPGLLIIFDLDGFKRYNDTFGHPAGDALLARLGAKLAAVAAPVGTAYRLGGDEFCLVARVEADEIEGVIDRAAAALTERGEGFEIRTSFGAVVVPDDARDPTEALHVADERLYAQKQLRRTSLDRATEILLEALSEHDPTLVGHLEGVRSLALEVGRELGLEGDELVELRRAAQLHDLGKLAVPDEILAKRDALDESEWAFVRQHTIVGERLLRASLALRGVAGIVRSTHERWDGTGYPDGLAGEEIPLAARIICACDAYDAMTSDRPYRPALSREEALAELERQAGKQFDPEVVRVLVALVRAQQPAGRAT